MNQKNIFIVISPIIALVIIDLIIKYWISNNLLLGQRQELIGDVFMIIPINNLGMAFGFGSGLSIIDIGSWTIKIIFSVLFIKILNVKTLNIFKLSSALILFGWIGNLLDRLFLSRGIKGYRFMDYFYDNLITQNITNISSILSLTGWIIFLIFIIIRFKDFKKIFQKTKRKQNN